LKELTEYLGGRLRSNTRKPYGKGRCKLAIELNRILNTKILHTLNRLKKKLVLWWEEKERLFFGSFVAEN
jgi:hypothetical protein